MRVRHVACGVRRCMWVWRLREDHVELSRCACVRKGRGRMCGSPLTYRARHRLPCDTKSPSFRVKGRLIVIQKHAHFGATVELLRMRAER